MKKNSEDQSDIAAGIATAKGEIEVARKAAMTATDKYTDSVTKNYPGLLVRFNYSVWSAPSSDANAQKFHAALKMKEKADADLRELRGRFKAESGADFDG
jgi:hypothetical protein